MSAKNTSLPTQYLAQFYLKLEEYNPCSLLQNNPDGSPRTPFPGVLGGWREDLQGKERRDSITLERDIFVTTNYGQVQGFKVKHFFLNLLLL